MLQSERNTRRYVLIASALASFLTPFMSSSINIALPVIGKELALDSIVLGWISTAFLLATAVFLIPCGRLGDVRGRKNIFLTGVAVFMCSSIAITVVHSATILIAFRVLQGIGAAFMFSTGVALLIFYYPASQRGQVLGINLAATYTGLSCGPFLGGILIQHWGWRSIFWVVVPIGAAIIILFRSKVPADTVADEHAAYDWWGALMLIAASSALMIGLVFSNLWFGKYLALFGSMALIGFGVWEKRRVSPLIDLALFGRNIVFLFSSLAALINYSATFAITFLLSLYLQHVKNLSAQQAGFILVAQPLVMALLSPLAGRLSDRIEPRVVSSLGMAICTVGLALFAFLQPATPLLIIVLGLLMMGLGFALFSSPNTNAIMSSVAPSDLGIASGFLSAMRMYGQMISMTITMMVLAHTIGRRPVIAVNFPYFMRAVCVCFIIFAALCAAGVAASLARGKMHPH